MKLSRSTRRAMLAVGVAVCLLVVAAAGIGLWRHYQRQRLVSVLARLEAGLGPLERVRHVAPQIRDEDNAGPAVLAAATDLPDSCREAHPDLLERPVGSWSRDERERAETRLAHCAPSLEALRAAAVRPQVGFPLEVGEEGAGIAESWSTLSALLGAARLLALDARRAAESGEPERLAADWSALAKISNGLAQGNSTVEGIVATAVQALELRLAHGLVESGGVPVELVAEMRRHFESLAAGGDLVGRSLATEVVMLRGAGEPYRRPWEIARLASGMECSYEVILRHLDAPWVELERRLDDPPKRCVGDTYADILLPNLRDAYGKFRTGDAARQLTIVALTVHERGLVGPVRQSLDGTPLANLPNRYTGETVQVEMGGERTLILSYPEARKLAQARDREYPDLAPQPPFEYRLPLPAS